MITGDSKKAIVISIDAMGGDYAPDCTIEGIDIFAKSHKDVSFKVFGDESLILPLLEKYPYAKKSVKEIIHTDSYVKSDEKPSVAVRSGRKSSMGLAINSVKQGVADACVSAGNTGALMAMSKLSLRMLSGISRPAIVSVVPSRNGRFVMLDLGANIESDAADLARFAVMGKIYCQAMLRVENPTVGLLNIGSEDIKGRDEVKEAARILKGNPEEINFHGFIEGNEIGQGVVDVVVTDGFSGNIALKTMEGTAKMIAGSIKDGFKKSWLAKIGFLFLLPMLKEFKKKYDPRIHNGAMFIGLDGISIKSHGNADGFAFSKAIEAANNLVKHDIKRKIKESVENYHILSELL
ncbi:MAG: Phosphate acyltransferase [Alphaproteobacteria bacterium ADurb.Bin438]|nr:MAG: Phosphate acyltransferase [Alphaproteobacteria bacterium ADurb.Bin438]